jgi:hypothetical protein
MISFGSFPIQIDVYKENNLCIKKNFIGSNCVPGFYVLGYLFKPLTSWKINGRLVIARRKSCKC